MGGEGGPAEASILQVDPARKKGAPLEAEELERLRGCHQPGNRNRTCLIGRALCGNESPPYVWRQQERRTSPKNLRSISKIATANYVAAGRARKKHTRVRSQSWMRRTRYAEHYEGVSVCRNMMLCRPAISGQAIGWRICGEICVMH